MDCSTPGFPVYHQLPDFPQAHVHWAIQPSHPLPSPSPPAFNLPASGSFPMSQFFASGGQSIGASALASVLSMNIQERFPSGLTHLISLQSKGPSRVFSNTQFKSISSSVLSFLYGPQPCLTHWNYEPCCVGTPKTDSSWWRVLTKRGPLEKGMANHFSILALRTSWTIWKGKKKKKKDTV